MIERYGAAFLPLAGFEDIRLPKTDRLFSIYWSKHLDHGLLYPDPTDDELAGFYDTEAYRAYLRGDAPKAADNTNRFLVSVAWRLDRGVDDPIPTIMKLSPTARSVCDIGCGDGAFLRRMQKRGLSVMGIDPMPQTTADFDIHRGYAEMLPEIDRSFGVVTMFHSLEHCRNPLLALQNAASLLSPGGLLVAEVPNQACLGFRTYRQSWFHTDAGRHLHFFTSHSLTWFCKTARLNPIKFEYSGYTVQFHSSRFNDGNPLMFLMRTALRRKSDKYDCIRIYAQAA